MTCDNIPVAEPKAVQHPRLWILAYDLPHSVSYFPQYSEQEDGSEGV
jgi:hypothetical protein